MAGLPTSQSCICLVTDVVIRFWRNLLLKESYTYLIGWGLVEMFELRTPIRDSIYTTKFSIDLPDTVRVIGNAELHLSLYRAAWTLRNFHFCLGTNRYPAMTSSAAVNSGLLASLITRRFVLVDNVLTDYI